MVKLIKEERFNWLMDLKLIVGTKHCDVYYKMMTKVERKEEDEMMKNVMKISDTFW